MRALGIDPGTRNLGWGLVERTGNRLVHIAHGVIRAKGTESLSKRLHTIALELDALLLETRPVVASVEQLFFHKDPQAASKLGHARGVVLFLLEKHGVELREHAPARIKQALTGNGQAKKEQVAQVVRAVLGLDCAIPTDASDALAMALTELRLDPRARAFEAARPSASRRSLPPHVLALVAEARLRQTL